MPRYRYACALCGAFDEMRPLEAYAEPCACPECGAMAPRELAVAAIPGKGRSNGNAKASTTASLQRHRSRCGCCGSAARVGLKAEAASAGAPRNGSRSPAASFLTRD
jgi:putative FmdB family regulatory protein